MNYLFYIIVFLSLCGIIFIFPLFMRRLKFDFFCKHVLSKIVANHPLFFSEYVVRESIKCALRQRSKKLENALLSANIQQVSALLKKSRKPLSLLLKAFDAPSKVIPSLTKLYKKNPKNSELAVWLAWLHEVTENTSLASLFWDKVSEKNLSPYLRAHYLLHLGKVALKNGDLEYASRQFYDVAALLHRQKCFYEEAQTYLHLGTIYRISFMGDVAETLFLSALKIYRNLKYSDGEAQTLGHLGILMIGEERFEEAEDYLCRSAQIFRDNQRFVPLAEIFNQQALLSLLKKDYKKATNALRQAKKIHSQYKNTVGIAFATELEANCFWAQEAFAKAAQKALQASSLYKKTDNISGFLDSLYLQAQSLFRLGNDTETEKILRQIITNGQKDCGCFHLANAYNLLGILYMRQKDLQRAKGLFQQSLDLEQRGVRLNALAIDYANMGLVEFRCGQKETARKNIQTALDFARETEDDDLSAQLQKYLRFLSN